MKDLAEKAETEKRALSEDEDKHFDELDQQVQAIDGTEKLKRAKEIKLDRSTRGKTLMGKTIRTASRKRRTGV